MTTMVGFDPWVLVTRAQDGDRDAYGELYKRYSPVVFNFALRRLGGDWTQAEDVVGETFTRGLRQIGSVSYQGRDVGAWFVTIARNMIRDHVKSSRYKLETPTPYMVDAADLDESVDPEARTVHRLMLLRVQQQLGAVLARLTSDQREVIELRFGRGLSVVETAALMGRNVGAAKAVQHRAVARLRELLGITPTT